MQQIFIDVIRHEWSSLELWHADKIIVQPRKLMTESCVDLCVCRCDGCGAVFHAECRQKAQPCPRCVHRELHHKRPSSFWSPDDDSPGCFFLPYQDTWDTRRRTKAVTIRALPDHCAGQSACFSDFCLTPGQILRRITISASYALSGLGPC